VLRTDYRLFLIVSVRVVNGKRVKEEQ
jgi:hypothetical protein